MTSLVLNAQARAGLALAPVKLYPAAWALTLLPVSELVLIDASHGMYRPTVWAARTVPTLLVLGLTLWAHLQRTPRAIRIRTELRLIAPVAAPMFIASSFAMLSDVIRTNELVKFQVLFCTMMQVNFIGMLPLAGWATERRWSAEASSQLSSRAREIIVERQAVAAFFIVVSWLNVTCAQMPDPGFQSLGVVTYLLPLAVGPAWYLLGRPLLMIASAFVPGMVFLVMLIWPESRVAILAVSAIYGLTMLALQPHLTRRRAARAPQALRLTLSNPVWPLRPPSWLSVETRLAATSWLALPLSMVVALVVHTLVVEPESLQVMATLFGAFAIFASVFAPLTALSEPRQLVMQQLVSATRSQVFRQKLVSTLRVVAVTFVVETLLASFFTPIEAPVVAALALVTLTLWAISFALATTLPFALAGPVVFLVGIALLVLQVGGAVAGMAAVTGHFDVAVLPHVSMAALVILVPAALLVAWRGLVKLEATSLPTVAAAALSYAFVLGATAALLNEKGLLP